MMKLKTKILFVVTLLCFSSFSAMGQNPITRNKPQTVPTKPKPQPQPKPKPQPQPQPQPQPKPQPQPQTEEAGYDVTFSCNVPSASLYIDGNANGNASGSRFLKTGNHNIKITASGYEEYTSQIIVNRQNNSFDVTLVKLNIPEEVVCDVRFSCNVPTGILYIDSTIMGNVEGTYSLKEGSYKIKVVAKGYEDYEEQITVNQKGQTCNIKLVKETVENAGYDVFFTCNVPSAILYIDGNANGNVSGSRFLKTGMHILEIRAQGYENYEKQIIIDKPDQSYTITLIEKKGLNDTIKVKNVEFVMVYVEGGRYTMGATLEQVYDAQNNEKPTHDVILDSYYIGQTEVTQALWEIVMGNNPSRFKGDIFPVENVSWTECQDFIRKLNQLTGKNFRLPTEEEWEYAARGGKKSQGYKYSGSNVLGQVAWYSENSESSIHIVKGKAPNELGLYDMSGNVREWCQDIYKPNYNATSQQENQVEARHVLRGGCWGSSDNRSRVSSREYYNPDNWYYSCGLRLVLQ